MSEAVAQDRLNELEASLRERERQLAEAHRIARLGTWRWVRATDETVWSAEVYKAFGLDPVGPAPGFETISAMHTAESRAKLEALVARALTSGESYEHDMELVLPDGGRRWILSTGEVEAYEGGEPAVLRGTIQDITDRKLVEEELQHSFSRYRSLVRASSEIVWAVDATGRPKDGNPEWVAFTGRSSEALDAEGWLEPVHPDDRPASIEAWAHSLKTGKVFQVTERVRRHDGVYRVMSARGVPARNANGEIFEWVGMHTDVTDRAVVESELREAHSRFDKLYRAGLIGICYPDRFGLFSDGNAEFLRIVGYSEEDLRSGRVRWDVMTPPEYSHLDAEHIAEAAQQGSCTPYEKEYIRKDGTRIPILCGFALREGSTDEYVAFVMDISPVKRAEAALRERELRFSALAESLPELVWMSTPKGARVYTNRRYQEYTGLSATEMLGDGWLALLHPEDRPRTRELWSRCMATGEFYENQYRIQRNDGQYRNFLIRAVPVRDDTGEILHWVGSATDIHDQKLAEEAVRRTEKLATAGRLAASIAHEINNPLAAVTNSIYLALMDDGLAPATREYLQVAEQELARAAHVTAQTLQFHRQTSHPAVVQVAKVMESAFSLFAARFRASSVDVEREFDANTDLFSCGDELRQVFANLLSNALDAMRHGGRLRIRISRAHRWDAEAKPGVRVTLGDTGAGIPAAVMARLFEPFLSTKDATGTGLGLWVSQGIVLKHKGSISVRSREAGPSRGTVFSIFFPLDGMERDIAV